MNRTVLAAEMLYHAPAPLVKDRTGAVRPLLAVDTVIWVVTSAMGGSLV